MRAANKPAVTAAQVRAARSLLRMSQGDLSAASGVPIPTIKRIEGKDGPLSGHYSNAAAILSALEDAGVDFIPENGGGPGVRLRRPPDQDR